MCHHTVTGTGTTIGEGTVVGARSTLSSYSAVEKDCELGTRARVRGDSQIHEGTRTGTDVVFELECHIGVANALGDGVRIGRRVHTEANVTIGKEARIGDDCVLVEGTMVAEGTEVTDGTMTEQDQHVG